jgi:hypothetical protein
MHADIRGYNEALDAADRDVCAILAEEIDRSLPTAQSKIWHRQPVWFLDGNPIVGYGALKDCVRLLFWSGQSFDASGLEAQGSFQAAEARYTSAEQVDRASLRRWLEESRTVQWDYKNPVKRKGKLERLL